MKKLLAVMIAFAFGVAIAGLAFAEVDTRTPAEKLAAGRAYINTLDAKIIKYRAQKNMKMVAKLQADKKGTMAALQKWKLQEEAAAAAPVAERVAPPPPARVTPPPAAPAAGLFGWGLNTSLELGMVAGMTGINGNLILPDPLGIGPMLGLSANAVTYKLGAGYLQGNDANSKTWKAVPLYVDGVITFPADLLGGVESFARGGINYVIDRSGGKTGDIGGQFGVGIQGDLGMGIGKTSLEVGYAIVRTGKVAPVHSSKSVSVLLGQQVLF